VADVEGFLFAPWIDANRIRAAIARDVVERVMDDRPPELRRIHASLVRAFTLASQRIKPKFVVYPRPAEPKPKVARSDETKRYFREYQRERRARQKADADLARVD
jgi:hypothetical protein